MSRVKSILIFAIVISLVAGAAQGKYSSGTGEPNDPYRIATAEDLNDIGNNQEDWDKHFILVNDVNLAEYTSTQFNMIGEYGMPFTGVFDGNDHEIYNFTWVFGVSDYLDFVGMFRCVGPGGQIKNLKMENVNINAQRNNVGGLVGFNEGSMINNCYSSGSIIGSGQVGGLVGLSGYGIITNCYSTGSVGGNSTLGGLVGYRYYGTVSNCYASGSVSGGYWYVGGLVGYDYFGTVTASFWDIDTSGQLTSAGGTPKTTAEMQKMATFANAGWDFVEVWGIGENQTYPYLLTEPAGDSNHDKKVDFVDLAILASHWLEGTMP